MIKIKTLQRSPASIFVHCNCKEQASHLDFASAAAAAAAGKQIPGTPFGSTSIKSLKSPLKLKTLTILFVR